MSKQNNMRSVGWRQSGWRSVGWKSSDVTVEAPADSILHYDADINPYTEQTGGPHTFNHAVLSPQYQRNADGSYSNVGAKPAVDTFDGERWLRSCGAVTNLLPSDYPSSSVKVEVSADGLYTRLINLSTDAWAACSYRSFSLPTGSKYTFETVVRAGVGANKFDLGFHYVDTFLPITATIQHGPGECLVVDNFCKVSGLSTTEDTTISITLNSELATALSLSVYPCGIKSAEVGDYTLIRNFQLTATPYPAPYTPPGTTMPASNATTTNGSWFSLPDGSPLWKALTGEPLTLATRVRMGMGSADLVGGAAGGVSYYVHAGGHYVQYSYKSSTYVQAVTAFDGTMGAGLPATWPRNAIINRVTQVNAAGTQFRVGYMIEGTHTEIQWSSWEAYDGSFDLSTLYRITLGYYTPYPMWFNKITAWKKQATDAEILEAMA